MDESNGPNGLLLVDKPAGITSHDAVDRVRRAVRTRKVGHAGTLDPMATGLLLIGVGRATRLLRFLGELPKLYEGTGILGVGEVQQRPPAYSAVKVGGEKLYRAARRGKPVEAPPRRVTVYAFNLRRFHAASFDFRVRCSGGTYVRSLIADVGQALGCGAHLAALRRTAIGPFKVEQARPPEEPGDLLPVERAVEHLAALTLEQEEARVAAHGSVLGPSGITGPYRVLAPDGRLIGIYRDDGAKAVPEVILPVT